MLPIGRRSGLRTAYATKVYPNFEEYMSMSTTTTTTTTTETTGSGEMKASTSITNLRDSSTSPNGGKYQCPESFERKRFIFSSSEVENQIMADPDTNTTKAFIITAQVTMEFCVHIDKQDSKTKKNKIWPAGDYCIFTMNKNCPAEMQATKEIPLKIPRFFLKSIHNVTASGEILVNSHWHEDAENHIVYFMQCCREDKQLLLRLPLSTDGFYLATSSGLCSTKGIDYTTSILGSRYATSQNISEKDVDEIASK
ncbi:unnamed protein product [Trichobilharzia regenti]|nr:unnamed protein product [Trichobilharzia regenti]